MTLRAARLQSPGRRIPHAVFKSRRIPILLRGAFLLFVFTIPLESLNLTLNLGPVSIARFAGLLLFGFSIVYHSRCYSIVPKPMLWFCGYLSVFVMAGGFLPERHIPAFVTELVTLLQLIVFFWIASNVLRNVRFAKRTLLCYGLSAAVLSAGVALGLPGFTQTTVSDLTGNRFTAVGYDPNYFGLVLAIAAVTLIGLILNKELRIRWLKFLLFPLLLVVLTFLIRTGSRSALVAGAIGTLFYLKSLSAPRRNLITGMLVIFALLAGSYLLLNDRDTMARWAQTIYEGETAGRDRIFVGALQMISERPFLGWGPVAYRHELNVRYDGTEGVRDAHNLILNLMLEVGIFGAMMFIFGILTCVRAALRSRNGRLGSIPLALLMLVGVFLQFQPWMASKPFWFVLALVIAAAGGMQRYPVRPRVKARFSRRAFPVPSPSVAFAFHLAVDGQPQPPQQAQNLRNPNSNQNVWNRRPLSS